MRRSRRGKGIDLVTDLTQGSVNITSVPSLVRDC